MKKQTKKLALSKQTLLDLDLSQVQGGLSLGCTVSYLSNCCQSY
jgi:hypothetical protein